MRTRYFTVKHCRKPNHFTGLWRTYKGQFQFCNSDHRWVASSFNKRQTNMLTISRNKARTIDSSAFKA